MELWNGSTNVSSTDQKDRSCAEVCKRKQQKVARWLVVNARAWHSCRPCAFLFKASLPVRYLA